MSDGMSDALMAHACWWMMCSGVDPSRICDGCAVYVMLFDAMCLPRAWCWLLVSAETRC